MATGTFVTRYGNAIGSASVSGAAHGLLAFKSGAASARFNQTTLAYGDASVTHGVATSIQAMPPGATISVASGFLASRYGAATGAATVAKPATGTYVFRSGAALGGRSHAATGTFVTKHGTAKGGLITYAQSSAQTKYGIAKTLIVGAATGKLVIAHGAATGRWGATGLASGQSQTAYGTPGSGSIFRAEPSFKTRYGTAQVVRSITC